MSPRRGYKHTVEARSKMSAAAYGRPPISDETRAKISSAARRRRHSAEHKAKIGAAQRAELGNNWRGDVAGYGAVHKRAQKVLPETCAHADGTCGGRLEVAFIHGTPLEFVEWDERGRYFSTRPEDYMRVCASHHKRYDEKDSGMSQPAERALPSVNGDLVRRGAVTGEGARPNTPPSPADTTYYQGATRRSLIDEAARLAAKLGWGA